jgi:hypothetical protein
MLSNVYNLSKEKCSKRRGIGILSISTQVCVQTFTATKKTCLLIWLQTIQTLHTILITENVIFRGRSLFLICRYQQADKIEILKPCSFIFVSNQVHA